jgi:hypothetical protein
VPQLASDRTAILNALQTALAGVNSPTMSVIQSPPWAINQDRQCNFWYEGDETDPSETSLSDRAVFEKFKIQVFWLPPGSQQLASAMVSEAWGANRSIAQALLASSTLGGTVSGLDIGPTQAGLWEKAAGNWFYALEIPVRIWFYAADNVGR